MYNIANYEVTRTYLVDYLSIYRHVTYNIISWNYEVIEFLSNKTNYLRLHKNLAYMWESNDISVNKKQLYWMIK